MQSGPVPMTGRPARPGFTLAELMVVTLLIAILGGIALPMYHKANLHARAGRIAGDLGAIRTAAYQYQARQGAWPADAEAGTMPAGLQEHIGSVAFEGPGYTLDWDNWTIPEGPLVGVSVIPSDPRLTGSILDVLGSSGPNVLRLEDRLMYFIESPFAWSADGGGAGDGEGMGPGEGRGERPGRGRGDNPGRGQGNGPGQGPGNNPGQGQGNGPGNNSGQGQGNDQGNGRE